MPCLPHRRVLDVLLGSCPLLLLKLFKLVILLQRAPKMDHRLRHHRHTCAKCTRKTCTNVASSVHVYTRVRARAQRSDAWRAAHDRSVSQWWQIDARVHARTCFGHAQSSTQHARRSTLQHLTHVGASKRGRGFCASSRSIVGSMAAAGAFAAMTDVWCCVWVRAALC